jgi:hypothetical protein
LAALLEEWTGQRTYTEQMVPAWDHVNQAGVTEHAKLDVVFTESATGKRTYTDVAVVNAHTATLDERPRRAQEDGRAAALEVQSKRQRYKAGDNAQAALVPFVLEAMGRPSAEAAELLRSTAPAAPRLRAVALGNAWQSLSVLVQTRLAEALLSAEHPRTPS